MALFLDKGDMMSKEVSQLSKVKPLGTTLFIGGKDRPLRFGFSAAAILQEHFGSLSKAMDGLSGIDTDVKILDKVLYALLSIDEEVTENDVTKWVWKLDNILEVVGKVKFVLNNHAPVASDDPTSPTEK